MCRVVLTAARLRGGLYRSPRSAPPNTANALVPCKTPLLDVVGWDRGKAPKQDRVVLGRRSHLAAPDVVGVRGDVYCDRDNRPPYSSLSCSQRGVASAVAACTHEAHASDRDEGRTSALHAAAGWARAEESAGNRPTDGRRAASGVILSCPLCQIAIPHNPTCNAARTSVQWQRSG